jgi:hypothetical protein
MALGKLFQLALAVTRKILADQQYDFNIAVARELDGELPGPFTNLSNPSDGLASFGAVNSMCEPNLAFPDWTATQATRRFAHQGGTDLQLDDATLLNPLGNAAGVGEFRYQFVLPPGSDGGTFFIDLAEANSRNVTIGIYDTNMVTVLASVICSTSPAFKTFSISLPAHTGLQSPHLYGLFVQTNVGAVQASPGAAYAKFVPTFPTAALGVGTFAPDPTTKQLNFVRIRLDQSMALGNQLASFNSGLYPRVNGLTDYTIETNSATVAVEGFNLATDGVLWTLQNGQPLAQIGSAVLIPNGGLGLVDVPLLAAADKSTQAFRVRAGTSSGPIDAANLAQGPNLTAPRAFYVQGSASYSITPNRGESRCIISGDSVTGGNSATALGFNGWFARFREWYPGEVIIDGIASQSLLFCVGPGNDPNRQLIFAQYLARSKPTDIVIDLGNNDYLNATGPNAWNAAAFQLALTGVVTNLLALAPQARIWLKSLGITQDEGLANGAGSTPANYATATLNVVTAINDPRVIGIDGRGALFWTGAQLADVVHPNTLGHGMGAEAMIAAFNAVFAL